MNDAPKERVFLSYASDDLVKVESIYAGLIKRNLNVWFDKKELKPGPWKPQILKAISRSRYFVICISNAALQKTGDERPGFQDLELNRAYEIAMAQPDGNFTIVPVRIEECDRGGHDVRLTTFQQYDLFDDFEKGLDKLAVDLGGIALSAVKMEDIRTEDEKLLNRLMGKALTLFYAGEYSESFGIFHSITILNPVLVDAWNNKGVALEKLERRDEAIEAFDKAIEVNSDYAVVWLNKGASLGKLGRHDEAIEAFDKAIETNPENSNAWFNKGVALEKLERRDEAIEAFDKAIEINPDNAYAWYNKGSTLEKLGRYDETIEAFDKAIEINPDHADAWFNKGNALSTIERFKEAIEAFDKVIKINPDDADAWLNKGAALGKLERRDEAAIAAFIKTKSVFKPDSIL